MTLFDRKVKRKQKLKLLKDFKKSMKNFKKMVKCSKCSRTPSPGEKVDEWHLDQYSEKIDLICVNCHEGEAAIVSE